MRLGETRGALLRHRPIPSPGIAPPWSLRKIQTNPAMNDEDKSACFMALRIDLKPHERLIIGDVSIRNGGRRASLTFETKAKFLREKDILTESQAKTACERLYVILQAIYLTDKDLMIENEFMAHANEIMGSVPSMGLYIAEIYKKIEDGDYYQALKVGQDLMNYEKYLTKLVE